VGVYGTDALESGVEFTLDGRPRDGFDSLDLAHCAHLLHIDYPTQQYHRQNYDDQLWVGLAHQNQLQ